PRGARQRAQPGGPLRPAGRAGGRRGRRAPGQEAVRVTMAAAPNDPRERGDSRAARWLLAPPSCGDQPPARVPRAAPRRSSLRLPLSLPRPFASPTMLTRTDSWGRGPALDDAVAGGEGEPGRDARSGSWA